MRTIPQNRKFIIADHNSARDVDGCPNPLGWYHSVAGIESTPEGLVATYRLSDSHTAVYTNIMCAHSSDGGRTWNNHQRVSNRNVWEHGRVWVAPQLSRLRDGRLLMICDEGHRKSNNDWPMLTRWQERSTRGMDNYLFVSHDNGHSWEDPVRIDEVGGEPGYIAELGDGTLIYTRTESSRFAAMFDPPSPWNEIYYQNAAVASTDGGATWHELGLITDAPYHGDSEVGIVELEPGHLMAMTRIGFGGGGYGQPSRVVHSYDSGRSWERPILAPVYGQRTALHRLQSGKLLVTYRNRWGTPASCAFLFDPEEELEFVPTSFLWERDRCEIRDGIMVTRTEQGREHEVEFSLYPVLTDRSSARFEVDLKRMQGTGTVTLSAGFGVRIDEGEIAFTIPNAGNLSPDGSRSHGSITAAEYRIRADLDTSLRHTYILERTGTTCRVTVDGKTLLESSDPALLKREVRFGSTGDIETEWYSTCAKIENPDDYSIDWVWIPANGYPDQFQRDRVVVLDYGSDSGYSAWTQMDDGTIVIADYNSCEFANINAGGSQPILRAYRVTEEDLA